MFVAAGISTLIATAVVAGSVFSLLSNCRPVVAMPDDDTAPILALMGMLVVSSFPAGTPPEVLFITAFGALAFATLMTGIALAILGFFKLGSLVRYLPYSVMGGYFAGAGLLLIQGAIRVTSGSSVSNVSDLRLLVDPEMIWRWSPAILVALLIRLAVKYWHQSVAVPGSLILQMGLFFVVALLAGLTPDQLMETGWLVGPFPEIRPTLWNPVLVEHIEDIQWHLVFAHSSGIGTIMLLAAISLMLTASGLSVIQRENHDINQELASAGLANTVSGLTGGFVALPSMSQTELAMQVGAPKGRLVGLVVAALCAVILFFGMGMIAWIPKILLSGLLMYLGGTLLERWLLDARAKLPMFEFLVVVIIVVVVALVGFLEGVVVGLLCAIVLFVVNSSRINVVRYALTGRERRSNVERNTLEEKYLRDNGEGTLILKLQGYLFFGTAAALVKQIEQRLEDNAKPPLCYAALDFAQVTDMDSSAALSFMKLAQEAAKSNFFLLLTGLKPQMQERLKGDWFDGESTSYVQIVPDLDHGIEWCEEHMLQEQAFAQDEAGIIEQVAAFLPEPGDHLILMEYLTHRDVEPGDVLARQGEPSDEMFLLQSCSASVFLETDSGKRHRIRRAGTGTIFGEVGFYLGTTRTATVAIDTSGELYILTQEANSRLEAEHPHIAAALHKFMIRVITRRLQLTTTTLQAVLT